MNLKDQVKEFVKFDVTDAHNLINDLAIGKKKFSMSIPAQQYDSDLVLQAPLDYINRLAPLNNLWPDVVECLEQKKFHEYDCADQEEEFGPNETCECGAIMIRQTLAKIKEAVGGS